MEESNVVQHDANWGFCEDVCIHSDRAKYLSSFGNILREAKLHLLSSRECKSRGNSLHVDTRKEICAWKSNLRKIIVMQQMTYYNGASTFVDLGER